MKTLSLDLRERILAAYDAGRATRQEVASRFMVSLGMVKKLLPQRRATGDIAPRHPHSGRKPKITADHHRKLQERVEQSPDLTLEELREALGVDCTRPAIHYALKELDLTYKQSRSMRRSKIGST